MILSKYLSMVIFFDGYFLIKEHTHFQKSKTVVLTDLNELIYRTANGENRIILPVGMDSYTGAKFCDNFSVMYRFSLKYPGLREIIKDEPWLATLEEELLFSFSNLIHELDKVSLRTLQFNSRLGVIDISGTSVTEANLSKLVGIKDMKTLKLPIGDTSRWFQTNTTDDDPEYEEIMYALITTSKTKEDLLNALRRLGHFKHAMWISKLELATKVATMFKPTEIDYIENDYMRRIATASRNVNCAEKLQKVFRGNGQRILT